MTIVLPLPDPPTARRLTEPQIKAVVAWVMQKGYERRRKQNTFDETDFLMGASVVFFALRCQDQIPASWILGPMIERQVLTEEAIRTVLGLPLEAPEAPEAPEATGDA